MIQTGMERNRALALSVVLAAALVSLPELALAQSADIPAFGIISDFLRMIVTVLVSQWARYLGMIALVVQFLRWKFGHVNVMDLGAGVLAIFGVCFAPSIVNAIWSSAGSSIQ